MPGGGRDGDLGGMDGVVVGKLNLDEPVSRVLCCFLMEADRCGCRWRRTGLWSASVAMKPEKTFADHMTLSMYSINLFYKSLTIASKASS